MSTPPSDESDEGTVLMPGGFRHSALQQEAPRPSAFDRAVQASAAVGFANALPVGTRLGEFVITRVIGEGGFGVVYEAHDTALERRVAVKEYMPADLAERVSPLEVSSLSDDDEALFRKGLNSFINEAKILAHFDNPSLVKVYRFWEANGTAYMVMPCYDGPTLQEALRQLRQPPDEAWLRRLLDPLTLALQLIHGQQVYHRDIAPDNIILLADTGRPVLLDFGAARRDISGAHQASHTAIVKPGYAPVEQYSDIDMKQGPWSDVYALAAVLHYAITGRKPPAAIARLAGDACVPLAQAAAGRYSAALLSAIDHALAVRPEHRTRDMAQFRQELGLDAAPVGTMSPEADDRPWHVAPPVRPGPPHTRSTGLHPALPGRTRPVALWLGAVLMLGALCAMGAGWWWSTTRHLLPPDALPAPPTPPTAAPAAQPDVPAAVPLPSIPLPFRVVDEFARIQALSSPGYSVVVQWKATPTFRIGHQDILALNVAASRDGHVYVLAYTPDDVLFQYFPNDLSPGNFVRGKGITALPQVVREPGTRLIHDGVVMTDPPGKGHVLVIVSRFPRDFSHLGQRRESIYPVYPVGPEAAALQQQAVGGAPIYLGRVICPAGPACQDEFGATVADFEIVP